MRSVRRSDSGMDGIVDYDPERARRTLSDGVLLFRWIAFTWMAALNLAHPDPFRRPALAWAGLAAAGGWTAFLTINRREERPSTLFIQLLGDLTLSVLLILISGLVVFPHQISGPRLFFATAYPLSTALAWGAARGLRGALEAAAVLSVALAFSRPLNDISLFSLSASQWLSLVNGLVNYLLAGGVTGVVARHLDRSALHLRAAIDDAFRSREHAARLSQHKTLARAIHDSVLQSLAFINKRGRELADQEAVPGRELLQLAEIAAKQELELRALILREPEDVPPGTDSLRDLLERMARDVPGVAVTVSAVGPIWLPMPQLEQLAAAVQQALDNVVEHAGASRAAIFAEVEDGWVALSVRDDGHGFIYNEEQLRAEGKAGMLGSMKGRVSDMGGRMKVHTAPGAGTEVEFLVPTQAYAR